MSYLLDIFNKRQPMPNVSAPQQMPTQMAMPSGGPNVGQPMPVPQPDMQVMEWNSPMAMPSGGPNLPQSVQGQAGPQPAQFRDQFQQAGMAPSGMLDQLNAQMSPPPGIAAMFPGGAMTPPPGSSNFYNDPGWQMPPPNRGPGGNAQNNPGGMGGMGGVSQMPAFQPPQPMPFNNRPMPQFGAPNFSLQGGMTAAPQPSPMNGMMKGMFGVR